MTILVTGSAGFIGFHLVRQLLAAGHRVVGLDNFNDYYYPGLKQARADVLAQSAGYVGVAADLCDAPALDALFAAHKPELVVHLAAQAGVRYSLTHPEAYAQSNLVGFLNILERCRHDGVPRLIYASSSSVYGGLTEMPYRETQRTDAPISLYAATKKANELIAHSYSHLYGLQTIGLRFFTVYGPWGRPDMAYWIFTEKILAGAPIPVFNHGEMQRDFTYIDDIVAGVVGLIDATADALPRVAVYNIGNHRAENLLTFIETIEDALGLTAQKQLLPMQPGDVPATYADVSALNAVVGYAPTTPISVGIPRFIEWYRAHPELTAAVAAFRDR